MTVPTDPYAIDGRSMVVMINVLTSEEARLTARAAYLRGHVERQRTDTSRPYFTNSPRLVALRAALAEVERDLAGIVRALVAGGSTR